MIRNLKAYEFAIKMIKFDNEISKEVNLKSNEIILALCYKFLTFFILNEEENQKLLENHAFLFIYHLKNNYNVNSNFFLNNLFKNNKRLLYDMKLISVYVQILAELIEKLQDSDEMRVFFLDSFSYLYRCKGLVIKPNQTVVINTIGSPEYSRILILFNNEKSVKNLEFIIEKFLILWQNIENSDEIIEVPILVEYFAIQLRVLTLACEEKNSATENRCQTYFPLRFSLIVNYILIIVI